MSFFSFWQGLPVSFTLKAPAANDNDRDPYQGALFTGFKSLLDVAMRYRWATIGLLLILLLVAVKSFSLVKNEFFPPMNTPMFTIDYWQPQGTDIRYSIEKAHTVEQALRDIPEIESVTTTVGRGAMRFMLPYKPEKLYGSYTQFLVSTTSLEDIPVAIQKAFEHLQENHPEALLNFKRLMVGPQPDGKIEARISGPDPVVLRQIAADIKKIYLQKAGGTAVRDDWRSRIKVRRPQFSEAQARRAGIAKSDIDDALLSVFSVACIDVSQGRE